VHISGRTWIVGALTFALISTNVAIAQAPRSIASSRSRPSHSTTAPVTARFEDVTRSAGIDFHLTCGTLQKLYIMDAMCGGAAFFDFDNDGWADILLVNGSTLEDLRAGVCHPPKLYRNNRDGSFTDVTRGSGLDRFCGWGMGVAIGDYDNDGFEDVYITSLRGARLYHNDHNGKFTDVTDKSGVDDGGSWGTSAAFADYDGDGKLDLYVANYVDLDLDHLPAFGSGPNCSYRGIPVSCGPRGLQGGRDRLYHNNGDGTFTDVTERLGIDRDSGYGLGVVWTDFNRDGCPDLYVANDSSPSLLYQSDCKGGFEEIGVRAGVAFSTDGRPEAGMGTDSGDYDNDGWPDLVKTNFSDDANNLYHNDHDGTFTDVAGPSGFGPVSLPYLAFGVKFFDYDNDGWKDIAVINGHVNPQVDAHAFGVTYAERSFLFHNQSNGRFQEVGLKAGAGFSERRVGRAVAVADFDNDGRLDLLVTNLDGSPVLLRNASQAGNALRIKLVGTRSNRDAFGARVEVRAGGISQVDEARANSGYLSASDPRLHFGLGAARVVDEITIHWPGGSTDTLGNEAANQDLVIQEGRGITRWSALRATQLSHSKANPTRKIPNQ
jgi:hypothetical protein